MVDWNEDGLLDLIVGQFSGRVSLYLNNGTPGQPVLTSAGYLQIGDRPILVDYDSVPFVDDWDEDGRKDLLVGDMSGRLWLYLNEGTNTAPLFNQAQVVTLASGDTLQVSSRSAPCMADLDNDGFEDLILGQISGNASYFRSLGENPAPLLDFPLTLQIGGETSLNPGPFSRFAALDWDGNGRLDLIGGPQDGQLRLFRQIQPGPLPPAPLLEVNFQGPSIVPDTGAVLNFTCSLENPSFEALHFDVWADLFCPDQRNWMAVQVAAVTLEPTGGIAHELRWRIPPSAPVGSYLCSIWVGDYQRLQVQTLATFMFDKVLDEGDSNPLSNRSGHATQSEYEFTIIPNPFNSTTVLGYTLSTADYVSLVVYNQLGQNVGALVGEHQEAGRYTASWPSLDLPTGLYFARLQVGHHGQVAKLLYLK